MPRNTSAASAADPILIARSELENLANRRTTLETRLATAEANLTASRSARRIALARDPDADLTGMTRAIRDGEEEIDVIRSTLTDLDAERADVDRRLEAAEDAKRRWEAGLILTGVAKDVDLAAIELERAMELVGIAFDKLVAAQPDTLKIIAIEDRGSKPIDLAAAILAEGINRHCAGAMVFEVGHPFDRVSLNRVSRLGEAKPWAKFSDRSLVAKSLTVTEAASALISDRLRARADDIVAGKAGTGLIDRDGNVVSLPPKPMQEDIAVLALEAFAFQTAEGAPRITVNALDTRSFAPSLAAQLLTTGVVARPGSAQAAEALAADAKVTGRATIDSGPRAPGSTVITTRKPAEPIRYRELGVISPGRAAA